MLEPDFLAAFIVPLIQSRAEFVVTGSVAVAAYGEPRLTHDVDVVINLTAEVIDRIPQLFPVEAYYSPPADVLLIESKRDMHGHANIIHHATGLKADLYFVGLDPLHRWALQNKRTIVIGEIGVPFAPPEYVIIRKLQFFVEGASMKHLRDVRSIVASMRNELHESIIIAHLTTEQLHAAWQQCTD